MIDPDNYTLLDVHAINKVKEYIQQTYNNTSNITCRIVDRFRANTLNEFTNWLIMVNVARQADKPEHIYCEVTYICTLYENVPEWHIDAYIHKKA